MLHKACLGPAAFGLFILCTPAAIAATSTPFPDMGKGSEMVAEVQHSAGQSAAMPTPAGLLSDADLADLRGGQAIVIANQTLTAIATGNSIGGDVSAGAVSLSDSALSGFNGLGNVVINTGSQVSLQAGMNVIINVYQ